MKKYLSMLAFVMMAMVSFTLQSCGDDDDNNASYQIQTSLRIDQKGNVLTDAECEAMIMASAKKAVAKYPSDDAAEAATKIAANELKSGLEQSNQEFGTAVFTFTLKCTKVSDGKQIVTYYVTRNSDGDIDVSDNKN